MTKPKLITWKIIDKTWYRTRVVAAKTKPLYPLTYHIFNMELVYLNYSLSIYWRFSSSG